MPKGARISGRDPVSTTSSTKSDIASFDSSSFVTVAIFSGIGLLVSLVAIILGMPAVWY